MSKITIPQKFLLQRFQLTFVVSYQKKQKKGFNCFHSPTKKIFVFMDVKFFENLSYYAEIDIQGKKYWMEDSSFPNQ